VEILPKISEGCRRAIEPGITNERQNVNENYRERIRHLKPPPQPMSGGGAVLNVRT
jgi:hypothetical protein